MQGVKARRFYLLLYSVALRTVLLSLIIWEGWKQEDCICFLYSVALRTFLLSLIICEGWKREGSICFLYSIVLSIFFTYHKLRLFTSWVPWEKFSLATFMPSMIILCKVFTVLHAGPETHPTNNASNRVNNKQRIKQSKQKFHY